MTDAFSQALRPQPPARLAFTNIAKGLVVSSYVTFVCFPRPRNISS